MHKLAVLALVGVAAAAAQTPVSTLSIPSGTRLELELTRRTPLHRVGQPITAYLTAPVYADDRLVLPVGTAVGGTVAAIHGPSLLPRVEAAMGGDFSPLPQVTVRFQTVQLTNGTWMPLQAALAPEGPPLHLVTSAPRGGKTAALGRRISSMYHQQEDAAEALLQRQTHWATLKSEAVDSLPYRPAALAAGTHYGAQLTAALAVPSSAPAPPPQDPLPPTLPPGLVLRARLDQGLSSATTHWGAPVEATVEQPALAPDGHLLIPQGSKLVGQVVEVRPARQFGRGGTLRFVFSHLELPGGQQQGVSTKLAAAASSGPVQLDGEGEAKASPPGGATPAIALGLVLSTAVKNDADNAWALNAGSGTHLHIWGTAMAVLLTRFRPVAPVMLGMGFVGAGRTVYRRWLGRGPEVVFPAATELEIQITTPGPHGPALPK